MMYSTTKTIFCPLLITILITGCVNHVFNQPMAVSTKSSVYSHVKMTGSDVSTDWSTGFFVLIPYVSDPRKSWDRVLDEAQRKNCNAVMDLQFRQTDQSFLWLFPPIVWANSELKGTAVQIPAQ